MRRVVLSVYVSLDGVSDMDENDQWTFPYWNDELEVHQKNLIDRADALLLGRKMFEHFEGAWSPRTNEDDPMADRMNAIPKYVASRSREAIEGWNGSLLERDALEAVRRLKQQDGSFLLVYAGGEFVGDLIEANLIDEYHLFIHPVVLGSGKPLFPRGLNKELIVTGSTAAATGVTILTLEPVRERRSIRHLDTGEDPLQPGGVADLSAHEHSRPEGNPMTTRLDLTSFKALSFDCYGTLIDWEAGIGAVLAGWAAEQGLTRTAEELLLAYADNEAAVERETPTALYPDVLAEAFRRTGAVLGKPVSDAWAARLGDSVPDWPAFPDSAEALARLAQHYKLIILSNVHRAGFAGSNQWLHGDFAAIITAEDVGAYKPAANHFRALDTTLPELGVARSELLHVAQSLFHDHVPAKREGLPSVWINRRHAQPGWGATPEPSEEWSYNLEFGSMAAFADAVDAAFATGTGATD